MREEITGHDLLGIFRRRWRVMLLFAIVVLASDAAWVVWGPRGYESVAKLYVQLGRENVALDPTATLGETVNLYATQESAINSILQMLESQEIVDQVVDRIGVDVVLGSPHDDEEVKSESRPAMASLLGDALNVFSLPSLNLDPVSERSQAARRLSERIQIWAPINSSVLGIRYEDRDPEVAQRIVDAWVDVFLREHLRHTRTEGSYEFFAGQVAQAKAALDEQSRRLQEAKDAAGLASVAGQQKIIEDRLSAIELESTRNQLALQAARAKTAALQAKLQNLSPTVVAQESTGTAHQAWDLMREKLYALQIQQQDLKAKFTDNHPMIKSIEEQVREVKEILALQQDSRSGSVVSPNPTWQIVQQNLLAEEASLAAHEAEGEALAAQRTAALEDLKRLNQSAVQIAALERQVEICEAHYRSGVEKLEQSRILEALDDQRVSSVSVVQPATFVEKPVSPNKRMALAAGLLIAAVGGACLALTFEYLNIGAARAPAVQPVRASPTSMAMSPEGV